jgi:hypothetical protein
MAQGYGNQEAKLGQDGDRWKKGGCMWDMVLNWADVSWVSRSQALPARVLNHVDSRLS